jgi:hypothetical protein
MKAVYKQHQGFEHLSSIISAEARPGAEDTSTKKYPNNKYFQFDDEDSSGRKYLKEKLNLEPNDRDEEPQKQQQQQQFILKQSNSLPKKVRSSKEEIHNSLIGGEL